MKIKLLTGMIFMVVASTLRADVLEMQNGDRYSGKVLSVTSDTVVLHSEVLGKITVPRQKVASLSFGTNAVAPKMAADIVRATNFPSASAPLANTNVDLSTALRQLGANTNFVGQVRQQLLSGSPEASGKYDEMVNGLLTGQLNLTDVRREAQSSAEQLRSLKRELGPEADESLDGYLKILDDFLKETANAPAAPPKSSTP
jgi:hypothetical protein